MAGIREVRVITTDGKAATVMVEYEDGTSQVIAADQISLASPLEPAVAKIQIANQLSRLSINLHHIEPDQIIIEWKGE